MAVFVPVSSDADPTDTAQSEQESADSVERAVPSRLMLPVIDGYSFHLRPIVRGGYGYSAIASAQDSFQLLQLANWNTESPVMPLQLGGTETNAMPGSWRPSFEWLYDGLGRRRGAAGSIRRRNVLREEWRRTGEHGAAWLAQRIRVEADLDKVEDVESSLIAMGVDALRPIIYVLSMGPTELQAEALLHSLRWIKIGSSIVPIVGWILGRYLEHRAPEVRLAAVRALRILPQQDALRLVQHARTAERDPDVLEAMSELK